jgi:hypothetical protein
MPCFLSTELVQPRSLYMITRTAPYSAGSHGSWVIAARIHPSPWGVLRAKWPSRAVFGGRRTPPANERPGEHSRTWRALTYGLKFPEADARLKQVKPEQ